MRMAISVYGMGGAIYTDCFHRLQGDGRIYRLLRPSAAITD